MSLIHRTKCVLSRSKTQWTGYVRGHTINNFCHRLQLCLFSSPPPSVTPLLQEAKKRLREAIDALMAGDESAEAEQAMEKWDKYVTNHPDHIKEQAAEEQAWEAENEPKNNQALHLMKTFVPPNIFHAGLDGLREGGLPPALAKRIFDRKVGLAGREVVARWDEKAWVYVSQKQEHALYTNAWLLAPTRRASEECSRAQPNILLASSVQRHPMQPVVCFACRTTENSLKDKQDISLL